MNDICEAWSLPWHALQRDLASGLGADVPGRSGRLLRVANVQSVTVSANSWLSNSWLSKAQQDSAARSLRQRHLRTRRSATIAGLQERCSI